MWGFTRYPAQTGHRDPTETEPDRLPLDPLDFTTEETWRLLRWCQAQGADEFTVDFNEIGEGPDADPFKAFVHRRTHRESYRYGSAGPRETTLYRLDADSIRALQAFFPSGLFHGPSYGSHEPWAENPAVYRDGRLMLGIVSHHCFGELLVSPREREMLAMMGLRGGFEPDQHPSSEILFGSVRLTILGYEFSCLAGGPEDHWLRVSCSIESIPHVFVGYSSLNIVIDTLDDWRRRLEALVAWRAAEVTLRTTREGFSLRMTRSDPCSSVRLVVDGRGMGRDLFGHLWEFTIPPTDVEAAARQCETIVREHAANLAVRPQTSIPNDPERAIRAGRRLVLAVG